MTHRIMKSYKLITFDVTGTLLNFRKTVGEQYAEIGHQVGITADPDLLAKQFKIQWHLISNQYPNYGFNSDIHFRNWWRVLVTNTFVNAVNCNINKAQLDELSNRLIKLYTTRACWELNDSVLEILTTINKFDSKVGIISNFDPTIDIILREMGIHHFFDFIICSYNAGFQKPDTKIFQVAREKSNILEGSAIHIGDDLHLDYQGAVCAGWDACLLYKKDIKLLAEQYPFVNTDYVFTDLRSIYENIFCHERKRDV